MLLSIWAMAVQLMGFWWLCWYITCRNCSIFCSRLRSAWKLEVAITQCFDLRSECLQPGSSCAQVTEAASSVWDNRERALHFQDLGLVSCQD